MPVDAAPITLISLVVSLHAADLIAEETCCLIASMCDQGLVCGEFQVEVIAQETLQFDLDLFGFSLGTGKPQQPIIRVADVVQSAVGWVSHVLRGKLPNHSVNGLGFLPSTTAAQPLRTLQQHLVLRMFMPPSAAVVNGQ